MTALSYAHGVSNAPLLGETIGVNFDRICREFAANEALVSVHEQKRFTYAELQAEVERLACALAALGIQHGERVGIWATNRSEWLFMQFATAKLGVVLVNINPAYQLAELEYALRQSECCALVIGDGFKDSDYAAMCRQLLPELANRSAVQFEKFPHLRHVIALGKINSSDAPRADGIRTWRELLALAGETPREKLIERQQATDRDDVVNIQYTSGTTGFPKGAALTHNNILNNGHWCGEKMRFTHKDRLAIPVPFYHCFGMVISNLACVTHGATMVLPSPSFSPLATLQAVAAERCTALHGVPTMFIAQLQHPQFKEFDLRSLRTGVMAGAPCPADLMQRVLGDDMHCEQLLIGYGQTEASPITNMTDADDPFEIRVNTVGKVMPHQELKIVDPGTGRTVPRGVQGEICFRGHHVMRGYYNNPDATRAAIDAAGWLHSGDLGDMDEHGYVRITGRLKDMIIRGGENIYPREIEEFLFKHPAIAEAYVVGVPDNYYGEQVMAWVKLRPGTALTDVELRDYCKGRLTNFKIPHYIKFTQEFPVTVTGKVQKFRMREIAVQELSLKK